MLPKTILQLNVTQNRLKKRRLPPVTIQ